MNDALQLISSWNAAMAGKPVGQHHAKIELLLRVYHRKHASETDERMWLLNEVANTCKAYLAAKERTDPSYAAFLLLGAQAEKQAGTIKKATSGWSAVHQVFGPSGSRHGSTKTIQHHLHNAFTRVQHYTDEVDQYGYCHRTNTHVTKQAVPPTSRGNYWLEALDPKHRAWGHMDARIFDQWYNDTSTTKNFWEWLEEKKLGDNLPSVQYLAPDQRWKYLCEFSGKKIYRHQEHLGAAVGGTVPRERFTTRGLRTEHSGAHFAIWVCSPSGFFYTNWHKSGEFHHSSFLSGGRVLAAGEWVVSAGEILLITHKTGHHAASPGNLLNALKLLDKEVDLSRTAIQIRDYGAGGTISYYRAVDFLKNAGNRAACASVQAWSGLDRDESWDELMQRGRITE